MNSKRAMDLMYFRKARVFAGYSMVHYCMYTKNWSRFTRFHKYRSPNENTILTIKFVVAKMLKLFETTYSSFSIC